MDPDWSRASCRGLVDLFFSEVPADVEQAKALCATCELADPCATGALERGEGSGVWGGRLFSANGAWAELTRTHRGFLYWRALRLTGNHHDAEDVVQETLLRAYPSAPKLVDEVAAGWLATVARRTWYSHLRSGQRRHTPMLSIPDVPTSDPDWSVSPELRAALDSLPPVQRTVLVLFEVFDDPITYIAERLGTTVNVVKLDLQKARERMRRELGASPRVWKCHRCRRSVSPGREHCPPGMGCRARSRPDRTVLSGHRLIRTASGYTCSCGEGSVTTRTRDEGRKAQSAHRAAVWATR